MRSSNTFSARRGPAILLVLLFCASAVSTASAQAGGQAAEQPGGQGGRRQPQRQPELIAPTPTPTPPAARPSETACGGFIAQTPPAVQFEIVGSDKETERRVYAQGDYVYLSGGAQQGVRDGQEFSVVRPRGQFRSDFTRKKGSLGVYSQEVGRLRVVRVRDNVSVAEVVRSCDALLFGDLLRPAPQRAEIAMRPLAPLDRFAEPTGRQNGRIVLARDGREVLARDNVVFIDLGAEDNVKAGDYLTVYRPDEHGVFVTFGPEIVPNARRDYQSDELRGGGFSNQSQRVQDVDGSRFGRTVKTPDIKKRRPAVPRKVVGEIVVLHVEGRTATAVVTRATQEIFTGDFVEAQ